MAETPNQLIDFNILTRLQRQHQALYIIAREWRHYQIDLERAIHEITETASRALEIERVSVWRYNHEQHTIFCDDLYEATPNRHTHGIELSAAKYPAYFKAIETEEIITVEDAITDPHTCEFAESYLKPQDIGAMLDVPIHAGGKLAGVLCHEHVGGTRTFYEDEVNTAAFLANLVGAAIEYVDRLENNRKVAELLRDEVAVWNVLFSQSSEGIVVLERDGSVYQMNKQYADMLGYSMEEALQLHVWDWDVQFNKQEILEMLRTVDESGAKFETKQRRKDGTLIDVELSNNGTNYKGKKLAFCIVRDITERKQTEQLLRQREQDFMTIVEYSPIAMVVGKGPDEEVIVMNQRFTELFGYTKEEIPSITYWWKLAYPEEKYRTEIQSEWTRRVRNAIQKQNAIEPMETTVTCKDGSKRYVRFSFASIGSKHIITCDDLTARKEMEMELQASETRYRTILETVKDIIFTLKQDGTISSLSPSFRQITGWLPEEWIGKHFVPIVHPDDQVRMLEFFERLLSGESIDAVELRILTKSGAYIDSEVNSVASTYDDSVTIFGILRDITERKRAEEQIRFFATTDSLTGIANRREFTRIMESEIDRVKRYGSPLSLIMYDLDHFKRVNDTFGHDVGDEVLKTVSRLVRENIRSIDVQGRWGGEDFMVLLPQTDMITANKVAEKLRQIIEQYQFDKAGQVTASFGITQFAPQDDIDSLAKRADEALYRAKTSGRNRVESIVKAEKFD